MMIGLTILFVLALWLVVAVLLSARIPRWLGFKKHQAVASWLLFPLVFVLPIADDLIGMWQFKQLCERINCRKIFDHHLFNLSSL